MENQNQNNPAQPAATEFDLSPNLDLMAAPDNGGDPNNPSTDMISGLPNLDADKNLNNPPSQIDSPNTNQNITNNQQASVTNPVFEKYRERLKTEYEKSGRQLPEDLSEDNLLDRASELYAQPRQLHPEVDKFNKAIENGVDPEQYFKTMQGIMEVESMESHALVELSLRQNFGKSEQRPNGWDDAKIKSTLDKMENAGFLDIEAEKIKTTYSEQKQQVADNLIRENNIRQNENISRNNVERENGIKQTLQYLDKIDNIGGLPISQSDKAEFANEFRYLVTPDEKTGTSPLLDMLQSDETLLKVALFLRQGETKVKEHLTRAKEGVKKDFFSRLDPEPRMPNRGNSTPSSEIDFDALSAPATN